MSLAGFVCVGLLVSELAAGVGFSVLIVSCWIVFTGSGCFSIVTGFAGSAAICSSMVRVSRKYISPCFIPSLYKSCSIALSVLMRCPFSITSLTFGRAISSGISSPEYIFSVTRRIYVFVESSSVMNEFCFSHSLSSVVLRGNRSLISLNACQRSKNML